MTRGRNLCPPEEAGHRSSKPKVAKSFRHPSGVVFDVGLPNSTYSYRRRDSNDTPLDEAFHPQLINTKIYSEKPRELAGQYSVWSCVCTDGACDICDL